MFFFLEEKRREDKKRKGMFIPKNTAAATKAAELRAATGHVTSMLRERVLSYCTNAEAIQLMVTEIGMLIYVSSI